MTAIAEWNFAGRLVHRLGPCSYLIDAATGRYNPPWDLPRLIAAYGASLIAAGLNKGDRVLIGCTLSPSGTLVYLGSNGYWPRGGAGGGSHANNLSGDAVGSDGRRKLVCE